MEIIHLALRTEFTFKKIYGSLNKTVDYAVDGYIGVADEGYVFSHAAMERMCKDRSIKGQMNKLKSSDTLKPLYGVRLTVVPDASEKAPPRGQFGCEHILMAKNNAGLKEIYHLVKLNYENFYYRGNISQFDLNGISKNVIVIASSFADSARIDYIPLAPNTPKNFLNNHLDIPRVAMVDNYYLAATDKEVYELFTAPRNTNNKTHPQHILTTTEWKLEMLRRFPGEELLQDAIENTHKIAKQCSGIVLEKAPMIKYKGKEKIEFLCKLGAKKRGLDIKDDGVYKERYEMEIALIKEKDYTDYFLVVANMISKAKKKMLVGPSRGSSAGSLVCYLLGITEVDPIPYDLIFERFIDINRSDLPDIDIDFPDNKRDSVIKELIKTYGSDKVKHISIVSKMKAKSAIGEWAKGLRIPAFETEELKNSIIERSGGDARAAMCLEDTFTTVDIGKDFIERFPNMASVSQIENHARHHGVHAAGIVVCNEPIENFAGVNSRDDTVMVDKYEAEYLNLLKIDVLGLRTLSVLEDCAKSVDMDHHEFYSLPLDDEKVFKLFNDNRLSGIFQFEGYSLGQLTRQMGVSRFDDIVAITALARPGALYSGGAGRYVKYRTEQEKPIYVGQLHRDITESTFGIVVYQEQILRICREIGMMNWTDVNALRKALSKSLGEEFFNKYKEKFLIGAKKNKFLDEDAEFIWGEVCYGGNYAFNKAHAVAYAMVSYWTAYMKAYHPQEFTVANLNNSKDEESSLKILRDATIHDGIKYCPVDPDESVIKWSVQNGVVVGGLTNLHGIGVAKARLIIKARDEMKLPTQSIRDKLDNPVTPFDILFPTKHYWGDIFKNPLSYGLDCPPSEIIDVIGKGEYCFIGKLKQKNIRDLNEYVNLVKRGGQILEEDSLMLSIKIEDDTDSIMCNIDRFHFEEIGREVAEQGVIDTDWYCISGEIKWEGRYVVVKKISKLDESMITGDDEDD